MSRATLRPVAAAAPRGLTLTELLVVVTILAVIMEVLLLAVLVGRKAYTSADTYIQVQEEIRRSLDAMAKELRQAGNVNNGVAIGAPGVQRLDFQIVRDYDLAACGGTCWGTDDVALPSGWIHYVLNLADAANPRLTRCVTANQLDAMPGGFAGCRVLASRVIADLASTGFTYDHANRLVTVQLQTQVVSDQLPGGSLSVGPAPLTSRIRLRNP